MLRCLQQLHLLPFLLHILLPLLPYLPHVGRLVVGICFIVVVVNVNVVVVVVVVLTEISISGLYSGNWRVELYALFIIQNVEDLFVNVKVFMLLEIELHFAVNSVSLTKLVSFIRIRSLSLLFQLQVFLDIINQQRKIIECLMLII